MMGCPARPHPRSDRPLLGTVLLLLLTGAALAGCGEAAPTPDGPAGEALLRCDPSSCPGCCQGSICQAGNQVGACGVSGLPCVVCQDKESCSKGQCIPEGARCTPESCVTGCCQDDQCQNGSTPEACGKGGKACATCASTQRCEGQVCACGPGACKGCCEAGACKTGTTPLACGTGGQPCKKCSTSEGCVAGICKTGGECSSQSCPGCCEGTICKTGSAKEACGLGGQTCVICGATETCTAGTCNDVQSCGPTSCSGCCQASKCLTGSTASACGKGGGLCSTCVTPKTCQAGGCVLDPASVWNLIVVSAVLDNSKTWDWPFYTLPDPYVVIEVAGQKGNTGARAETYTPQWDEYLFSITAGTLTTSKITITVYDDDYGADQVIGSCTTTIAEDVLLAGLGIVSGCGADVKKIEIKFALQ